MRRDPRGWSPTGRHWVALMVAVVLAAAGCSAGGGGHRPVTGSQPSPQISVPPSSSPSNAILKPVLSGLVDRQGEPPVEYLGVLGGWVVNAKWSDLQPTPGGPIATGNVIDQAIQAVRQLN